MDTRTTEDANTDACNIPQKNSSNTMGTCSSACIQLPHPHTFTYICNTQPQRHTTDENTRITSDNSIIPCAYARTREGLEADLNSLRRPRIILLQVQSSNTISIHTNNAAIYCIIHARVCVCRSNDHGHPQAVDSMGACVMVRARVHCRAAALCASGVDWFGNSLSIASRVAPFMPAWYHTRQSTHQR